MSFTETFKNIINHIDEQNQSADPRGLKVKESILSSFVIDPTQPIANFTKRKFNWKYLAGELAWYLNKDRDVDFIGNFSNFWGTLTNPGTNEINSNYGSLVFNKEQFGWVIDSLVADQNSRQAIMFFNNPNFQFEGNKDFVCTMYANFFIRDNKLNMKVQMRSNDIFYGLTFDAPFFAFLLQSIHIKLIETYPDLQLGDYYHFADNLHFYERHFELATAIQTEEPIKDADNNFVIKEKFIDYDGENVFMTPFAEAYCKEVYETIGEDHSTPNQESYKKLLEKYFIL
jgi:thymidylate synthase